MFEMGDRGLTTPKLGGALLISLLIAVIWLVFIG